MIRKFFLTFFCVLIVGASFFFPAFADTYTPYTSTLPSSQYAQSLYSYYASSEHYDPQLHWVCWSAGSNHWFLAVEQQADNMANNGGDLTADQVWIYSLEYVAGSYNTPSYYYTYLISQSNFTLHSDRYICIGNIIGTVEPEYADQHDFRFIIIPVAFLLLFVLMFHVFRIRFDKDRSFKV